MLGRNKINDKHTWVEERLSDYIDNQLALSDRAELDKHLAGCDQCRTRLESLRWTIALVKQAPAPISKRSFTLVVPPKRQPSLAFGLAGFATVVAMLLLFAVIGIDLLTPMSNASVASVPALAPAAGAEKNAPATSVALAPQPTPTTSVMLLAAPTAAPQAASSSSAASAQSSTLPPAPAALPSVTTRALENGATDSTTMTVTPDNAPKSLVATPSARQPLANGATLSATVPAPTRTATATPTATATATPVPPTATLAPTTIAQAPLPTRRPIPQPDTQSQPIVSPLRIAEIALLFVTVFFGVMVVLLRRR